MLCILRCTIVKWSLRTDKPGISLHDELVELTKLTLGPGLGCTSPDINRSKEITQTMLLNKMFDKYWQKAHS